MPIGTRSFGAAATAIAIALAGPVAGALPTPAIAGPVLLLETATGKVLYAEEPDRAWHPASITKLMTAYLTFEAVKSGQIRWDDDVPLSEYARSQPATRIGLRGGIRLNVEQAVRGLVLRSANDFAVALAERVGGTEIAFVERMNQTATRLGMARSRFKNPHGLPDPEQVTTARDMALLTTALLRDFPERAEVFSTPTVRIHKGTFHSQNDLLRNFPGADGMKTGFTCASGYNVVASATRDGHRLVAVVLGATDRVARSEQAAGLLEAGFVRLGAARPADVLSAAAMPPLASPPALPPFEPVKLTDMALAPAEAVPPHDMARETRTRKCGNPGRRVRRVPTAAATLTPAAAASERGAPAASATADPKPAPSTPAAPKAVLKAKAKSGATPPSAPASDSSGQGS
jgi:D-alanyl-D-alanine carboxypeptidase